MTKPDLQLELQRSRDLIETARSRIEDADAVISAASEQHRQTLLWLRNAREAKAQRLTAQ